eukprot:11577731-Ditylum_brightwellii.AAC.1
MILDQPDSEAWHVTGVTFCNQVELPSLRAQGCASAWRRVTSRRRLRGGARDICTLTIVEVLVM